MTEIQKSRSPLFIIFTTVLMDLVGFGMIVPLMARGAVVWCDGTGMLSNN